MHALLQLRPRLPGLGSSNEYRGTMENSATALGAVAQVNLLNEFWPYCADDPDDSLTLVHGANAAFRPRILRK